MATPCRRDCAYYSTYTETCDFTLINYRVRPCPTSRCTEYKKREILRTWQVFNKRVIPQTQAGDSAGGEAEEVRRRIAPHGEYRSAGECFSAAGCGHEVYPGERIYTDEDGKKLCPDCVEMVFSELSVDEKAYLLGYERSGEVR